MAPDASLLLDLHLCREAETEFARLAMVGQRDAHTLTDRVEAFLHPREREFWATLAVEKRQREFLLGRLAAKHALAGLLPESVSPSDVEIRRGVFHYPVVIHPSASGLAVSLTHAGACAAAVAFPAVHPLGIDIETVKPGHLAAFKSQVHEDELPPASAGLEDVERYARVWTVKEALSKVLRCGLMTPFRVLQLTDPGMAPDGAFTGGFVNFPQWRFLSLAVPGLALALVHPARTRVVFERDVALRFLAGDGMCPRNTDPLENS